MAASTALALIIANVTLGFLLFYFKARPPR